MRLSYPLVLQEYDETVKRAKFLALTVSFANRRGEFGQYFREIPYVEALSWF